MSSPRTIGLLSDVHANLVALEAVLDDMDDVDALVCAGDVVGYGPSPERCLEMLRHRDIPTVMGNHDRAVVAGWGYEAGDEYAVRVLGDDQLDWLESLPRSRTLFDGQVRVVHDHPEEQDRYTLPAAFDPELLGDEDVLVLGHTHIQHAEEFDQGIVLNPGSVGQPRDGNPEAAYATLDLSERSVTLHRVSYDIERVQTKIKNLDLSNRAAARLGDGR